MYQVSIACDCGGESRNETTGRIFLIGGVFLLSLDIIIVMAFDTFRPMKREILGNGREKNRARSFDSEE